MLKLFLLVAAVNAPADAPPREIPYEPPEMIQYGSASAPIAMPFTVTPAMCFGRIGLAMAQQWVLAHPGFVARGAVCKIGAAATEKHA